MNETSWYARNTGGELAAAKQAIGKSAESIDDRIFEP